MKIFWWFIATYLIIGIVVTLQNSLGAENRRLMKLHGVGWREFLLGIIIGPIGYVIWEIERIKNEREKDG